MARRTLQEFVGGLPERVARVAVHVGEQRGPALAGEVLLTDYRSDAGLDVGAVVSRIQAIADNAGWPSTWPSFSCRAYAAEDGKRPVDTYQDTSSGWDAARGSAPVDRRDLALEKLTDAFLEHGRILRDSLKDVTSALAAERAYSTERAREAAAAREEKAELEAANSLLEGAVEAHQRSDELEVKLKGFEVAERAIDNVMAARMSPGALKKWAKANPDRLRDLKSQLTSDPELMALFMG